MQHNLDVEKEIDRIYYWTHWDEYENPSTNQCILARYEEYLKYYLKYNDTEKKEYLLKLKKWIEDTELPNEDDDGYLYKEYKGMERAIDFLEGNSTIIEDLKIKNKKLKKEIRRLENKIEKNTELIKEVEVWTKENK